MTDNVTIEASKGALIANSINSYGNDNYEFVTIYDNYCDFYGYTHLGLKANFKSWVKQAIKGEYGLMIILTVRIPNIASSQMEETQEFYFKFSNYDMYGNTYNFETEYE
jgi:hypothetical protein